MVENEEPVQLIEITGDDLAWLREQARAVEDDHTLILCNRAERMVQRQRQPTPDEIEALAELCYRHHVYRIAALLPVWTLAPGEHTCVCGAKVQVMAAPRDLYYSHDDPICDPFWDVMNRAAAMTPGARVLNVARQ